MPRLFDHEDIYLEPEDFPEYDEYDRVQDAAFVASYADFNDEAFYMTETDTDWEDLY